MRRLASLRTREGVGWSSRLPRLHDFTFYASRDKKSDRKRLNYAANCTPAREPSLILSPSADRELTDDTSPNLEWRRPKLVIVGGCIHFRRLYRWIGSGNTVLGCFYRSCLTTIFQIKSLYLYDVFNETTFYPKHPVVRKSDFHQVWLSNWIWAYVFDAKPRKCLCEISIHILNQAK